MNWLRYRNGLRGVGTRALAVLLALALVSPIAAGFAFAETQTVIDPTAAPEPETAPPPKMKGPAPVDPALRRERQRAQEEQRKRARAEARALAAEQEAERLRAAENARQEIAAAREAGKEAAREAAKQAGLRKAAAAKAAKAKWLAQKEAAESEAAAAREAEAKAAARRAAARVAADRIAAANAATARLIADKEAAEREEAARIAAQEAAAREAVEAARVAAAREAARRDAARALRRDSGSQANAGTVFRDCSDCPELAWLPRGEIVMGEALTRNGPQHPVRIDYPLAVGRFEVTFAEWDACVAARGCQRRPDDAGWGHGRQPVINVSWADAQQYVRWLSRKTGKRYRLLSEAEWEYAARGASLARYWWGNEIGNDNANCRGCGSQWDGRQAAPVGSFVPNPYGLHDMHGNVAEWVEDCYHDSYRDAPDDGSAWTAYCPGIVDHRAVRGGAWQDATNATRSAAREFVASGHRDARTGFRVARPE